MALFSLVVDPLSQYYVVAGEQMRRPRLAENKFSPWFVCWYTHIFRQHKLRPFMTTVLQIRITSSKAKRPSRPTRLIGKLAEGPMHRWPALLLHPVQSLKRIRRRP